MFNQIRGTNCWALGFLACAGLSAGAATIVKSPLSYDAIIGERQSGTGDSLGYHASADNPTNSAISPQMGVGGSTGNQTNSNVIIGFALPTLADGESISSVILNVKMNTKNNAGSMHADLYGLGVTDPTFSPDSTGTSLFLEAGTDATQTKIANDVLTDANTTTGVGTYPNFQIDVTSFVTSLYTDTTPTGGRSEIFFRLNPDTNVTLGTIQRFTLTNIAADQSLTFTTVVPEPGTGLLLIAASGLILRRSRRA